jgi:hypothetical protein
MNGRSNVGILTLIVFQGLTEGCNQGSESPNGLSRMSLRCLQRNSRLQTLTLCSMVLIRLRAWNLCVIQLSFQMPKQALNMVPLAQNGHKILESVRFVSVCPPYTDHYSARKISLSHTECL